MLPRGHTYAGLFSRPDRVRWHRLGELFSGPPKPPAPPPPTAMPDPLDPAFRDAERRSLRAVMARSGRASTNLTGDDYSNNKLGSR